MKLAYDQNDLSKVAEIFDELQKNNFFKSTSEIVTEKNLLELEVARLKRQIRIIENEIVSIKMSDTYRKVMEIIDWDDYFNETKTKLQEELDFLQNEIE